MKWRYCKKCKEAIAKDLWSNKRFCEKCKSKLYRQCMKCDKLYEMRASLIKHMDKGCQRKAELTRCSVCKKGFKNLGTLTSHMRVTCYGGRKELKNSCSQCKKHFKTSIAFKTHIKFCGKQPDLSCEFCPYRAWYPHNLREHLHVRHSNSSGAEKNEASEQETEAESKNNYII